MERAMLEYLANALWQLPVLAAGAWVLLWLVKPRLQTQYRVWLAVLGLAVLLPAYGIRGGEIAPAPGATLDQWVTTRIVPRPSAAVVVDAMAPATVVSEPLEEGGTVKDVWQLPLRVQRVHLSATAMHWVMGVYASSVLLGLLRVVRAWWDVRRLVETSREVVLCSAAEAVLHDFGRSLEVRLPEVRECAEVTSPMVVGAASPVVLLPEGFAEHGEDEVKAALLHELAHVKRRDYLMNGICQVAVLPVGWHPVACGVQRRIRRTREMVCDEMAAREMNSEIGYARCLVTMARGMLGGLTERPEFVGLFSNNVLEERVTRLIETKTVLSARTKLVRLASGATAMATATLMAASFHVVPTMAAENAKSVPELQTAVLRSADGSMPFVILDAPVQTAAKTPVAPSAPALAGPAVAPVAPVLVTPPDAVPEMTPVAPSAPQSVPALAPPAPPMAPATPPAVAPVAPAAVPVTPKVAPVAPKAPTASEDEKKVTGSKNRHSLVYQMTGPDGDGMVIVDGEVRALTPEERQRIEKAMADSAEGMRKAMEVVNGEKFKTQMAEAQRELAKVKANAYFDSDEFNQQMNAARQEIMKQSAWMNSAEFQEKMAKVQAMVQNMDMQPCLTVQHCKCKDGTVKEKEKQKEKQKTEEPKIK